MTKKELISLLQGIDDHPACFEGIMYRRTDIPNGVDDFISRSIGMRQKIVSSILMSSCKKEAA